MRLLLLVGLILIIVGGVVDLILDAPTHWLSFHVFFELAMIGGALVFTTALWLGWWQARTEAAARRSWLVKRYSSAFGRSLASRYDSAARRIAFCHTTKSRYD